MTKISETLNYVGGNMARPTRYSAIISPPPEVTKSQSQETFDVLCKSVVIPPITNNAIEIFYKGHPIKIPGRTVQEQTIQLTFYLDEKHTLRKLFEDWIAGTDDRYYATNSEGSSNIAASKNNFGTLIIKARDFDETVDEPMNYVFDGVFPTEVTGPEYGADMLSAVQEFTVTLSYWRFLSGPRQGITSDYDDVDGILVNSYNNKSF